MHHRAVRQGQILFTGGPGPASKFLPLPEAADQVITRVAAAVREAIRLASPGAREVI